jgi:flagellar biosynthetic protein FlhB
MAEEMGDKTEAPTPRRRQEARDEGQVAHSRDLSAACILLGGLMLLKWQGGSVIEALRLILGYSMSTRSLLDLAPLSAGHQLTWALLTAGRALFPLAAGLIVIAVVANFLQVGFMMNFERLMPRWSALNPLNNIGRLFKGPGLMNMLMSVLKLVLVAMTGYSAVHGRLGLIFTSQRLYFMQSFALGATVLYEIALRVSVLLLVLALIDYGYQRFQFERDLRMSKQEIKEEMRSMDGDPKIKQRRRQVALQLATKALKKTVPKADVVVTNPTTFAIALKYDATSMRAPRVIAKGRDLMAARIREIAVEHGIPILERKPLARALYKMVNIGQEIPEEFYATVAEILAYVYDLTRKARERIGV